MKKQYLKLDAKIYNQKIELGSGEDRLRKIVERLVNMPNYALNGAPLTSEFTSLLSDAQYVLTSTLK